MGLGHYRGRKRDAAVGNNQQISSSLATQIELTELTSYRRSVVVCCEEETARLIVSHLEATTILMWGTHERQTYALDNNTPRHHHLGYLQVTIMTTMVPTTCVRRYRISQCVVGTLFFEGTFFNSRTAALTVLSNPIQSNSFICQKEYTNTHKHHWNNMVNWSTRHTRLTSSTYSSLNKQETKALHIQNVNLKF